MTVLAYDTERRRNADLIADCVELDYIGFSDVILDPTYGLGNWWTNITPHMLRRHDLDPEKAPDGAMDFTALAYDAESFDVVAFDPPYKLNGRPDAAVDAAYGVHERRTTDQRITLMLDGLTECIRVVKRRGYVLAKCQDQVVSGNVVWQTRIMAGHAEEHGCRLVDQLHVSSYRRQPPGRRQVHAARNVSTLLVLRKNR